MKKYIYTFLLVIFAFAIVGCQEAELTTTEANVPENVGAGYVVSQVTVSNAGSSTLSSIVINGSGAENFSVDSTGKITVSQTAKLDYESTQAYDLTVTATNTKGESVSGDLSINILDVPDILATISGFEATVLENSPTGVLLGQVHVNNSGDSEISAFSLSDESSFSINNKGEIRTNISFDFEYKEAYVLDVYASNGAGISKPTKVYITISNVADVIPLIMGFDRSVNQHIKVGSIIGTVSIKIMGDSPISKFTLSEPDTFDITKEGVVTTKIVLDKKAYALEVVATNEAGTDTGLINLSVKESYTINFINAHCVADIDSDGDLDVIDTNGNIQWHENQGNNQFVRHSLPFQAQLVFAEDIDNDADIDIISREGSEIVIYKNDGHQNFVESQRITRNYGFYYDSNGIYLADMDNDGRIDILAAWLGQNWYKNEENGTFTKQTLSPRGKDIIAYDIDSDGDMDFIESDNKVFWHENNGTQVFSAHQLSDDDIGGASSYAIDIDNDNDIDIVSTRRWSNGIDLYLNDGNQNFTKVVVSTSKNSGYTYATDIDKDGYIDILNGTIWYKNDGNNNFVQQSVLSLDNQTLIELVN